MDTLITDEFADPNEFDYAAAAACYREQYQEVIQAVATGLRASGSIFR